MIESIYLLKALGLLQAGQIFRYVLVGSIIIGFAFALLSSISCNSAYILVNFGSVRKIVPSLKSRQLLPFNPERQDTTTKARASTPAPFISLGFAFPRKVGTPFVLLQQLHEGSGHTPSICEGEPWFTVAVLFLRCLVPLR